MRTEDTSEMTTELPSINSTTSISDNVALRNYYDKLLFKNSSGKSLTDLPRKAREEEAKEKKVDFINGFRFGQMNYAPASVNMMPSNSEPMPTPQMLHMPVFQLGEDHSQQQNQQGQMHSTMPLTSSMNAAQSRNNSIGSSGSSGSTMMASPTSYYAALTQQSISPSSALSPVNSAGTIAYPAFGEQQYTSARRSSYISDTLIHGQTPEAFMADQLSTQAPRNGYLNFPQKHQSVPKVNYSKPASQGNYQLDNGLILLNGQQIVASPELKALYSESGKKYFSSAQACEFLDSVKEMLSGKDTSAMAGSIQKFLVFLKSCNLNYNPQSDAFVSGNESRRNSSTSAYLHYKPLVLVALKNGKLELLSIPQSTNLLMCRNDLVIIDGDRGKDLALVVEPHVDLDLALFINFLKKKIHFDSLITNREQHFANHKFVKALIDTTRGQSDDLNSKLYDVIELTQLIIPSKQVLRFATSWEVTTNLHNKFQDELKALHIAQLKLKSLNSGLSHHQHQTPRAQLNIKILNADFQFDRKKLTFYYVCQERNDFRELIKELFKFYKTRIWLCAIPNNLEIDSKYYDNQLKELKMYQEMMQHCSGEEQAESGAGAGAGSGFIVAPALNAIELDNFQIGVYRELVKELFA